MGDPPLVANLTSNAVTLPRQLIVVDLSPEIQPYFEDLMQLLLTSPHLIHAR